MKRISSPENPRFRTLLRLVRSSRQRREAGLSVLDGAHLVSAYREHVGAPERVFVSETGLRNPEIAALLERVAAAEVLALSEALFRQVSSVVTPTGIIAVVRTPRPARLPEGLRCCVLLEDLQDPGNLGSVLRSAAAAGVRHVLLSQACVHPWSPRVLRAGMGAHFLLQIHERADLVAAARAFDGLVLVTSRRAPRAIYDTDLTGRVAFVFGSEGSGVSPALRAAAHAQAGIPLARGIESLNVAAAAAVCLFERVRQLSAGRGPLKAESPMRCAG
jgi:TrmH family RNA methyltransferase